MGIEPQVKICGSVSFRRRLLAMAVDELWIKISNLMLVRCEFVEARCGQPVGEISAQNFVWKKLAVLRATALDRLNRAFSFRREKRINLEVPRVRVDKGRFERGRTVVSSVDFPSRICKSEQCEIIGVHLAHKLTPFHVHCEACATTAGELCALDFIDEDGKKPHICGPYHHVRILTVRGLDQKPTKSLRDPWVVPSPIALDESILRATSDKVPRIIAQLAPIIENDYGQIAPTEKSAFRRLQRRLKKLCEAGAVLQVDVGKRLFAYIAPDSRMVRDTSAIRELVMENLDMTNHRAWLAVGPT